MQIKFMLNGDPVEVEIKSGDRLLVGDKSYVAAGRHVDESVLDGFAMTKNGDGRQYSKSGEHVRSLAAGVSDGREVLRQPFTSTGPVPCGRSFSLMMPRHFATSV